MGIRQKKPAPGARNEARAISTLRSPSLSARAAAALRAEILSGKRAPGDEIAEQDLCQRLGMSRTPVREALKELSAEGLVGLRRNRPAMVAHFDRNGLAHLFEVQICLESFAARLAASRLDAEALTRLDRLQQRIEQAAAQGDRAAYTRWNRDIHREIVAGSGNSEIIAMHAKVIEKLRLARNAALNVGRRLDESVAEHRAILQALTARDAEAAARLVEAHDRRTADLFLHRPEG